MNFFFSMTYKPAKDGSTSTLMKHLKNKHFFVFENKEKQTGAMDKFVKKLDTLVCILFLLLYFIINYKLYLIFNLNRNLHKKIGVMI